jgi:hypothetical protein
MKKLIMVVGMFVLFGGLAFAAATAEKPVAQSEQAALEEIVELEGGTFVTWYGESDPTAYAELFSDKATYFGPGLKDKAEDGAVKGFMMGAQGLIPKSDWEILNPRVDLYGEVAVFTFMLKTSDPKSGEETGLYQGTAIFNRVGDSWKKVHAHFSAPAAPPA